MKKNISNSKLKEFGLLIGFGFPFIIGLLIPLVIGHSFRFWTLFIALPALLLGIFLPRSLFYPYKLWMSLGYVLGWLNSRIILCCVFIFALLPIAFIMKILGHDPLKIKNENLSSYKEHKQNKFIDLTRIF
tara:strand:- start:38 stop:430 length:393 start_codon:yes stop_codon:yes gene_type:complete